jgi:hypothetical protein
VKWQDHVHSASAHWTSRELTLARNQFVDVFGQNPQVHGAAGWQINRFVPRLESDFGFRFASDVRGECPFIPVAAGGPILGVPQVPTTLPTFDELIGRADLNGVQPADYLLNLTAASPEKQHVFTLHAELEGGAYIESFEHLLRGWQSQGRQLGGLSDYYETLDLGHLPYYQVVSAELPGRSGLLACQSPSEETRGEWCVGAEERTIGEHNERAENLSFERVAASKAERHGQMIAEMAQLQALHDPFSINFDSQDDPMADAAQDLRRVKKTKIKRPERRDK